MRSCDITVIIPTRNRPNELEKCLNSINQQVNVVPGEILIVDSSDTDKLLCLDGFKKSYLKNVKRIMSPAGTSIQRNLGARLACCSIVAFLDDDCLVSNDYFEQLEKFYLDNPSASGAQAVVMNYKKPMIVKHLFNRIFMQTDSFGNGKLRLSGAPSYYDEIGCRKRGNPQKIDLLRGFCSSFRKNVFEEGIFFNENFPGYGLGEDYEFSYRVSRQHSLFVVPNVKIFHYHCKTYRIDNYNLFQKKITNIFYCWFHYKKREGIKAQGAFSIYVIGVVIESLFHTFIFRNFDSLKGALTGIKKVLFRKPQVDNILRIE